MSKIPFKIHSNSRTANSDSLTTHIRKGNTHVTDINLRQIILGLAWHYKKCEKEQDVEDRSIYANAEYLAQRDKHGLWVEPNPVAPWDRKEK